MADLKMPDLNKVFLAGRLTRDPELRYLQSGTAVCEFGLAVSRKYKQKDGQLQDEVLFIDVTSWGKTAEFVGENFRKGRPILVEGKLKSETWQDKSTGKDRSKIKINAERVQALTWDERKEGQPNQAPPQQAPRAIEEPVPEDDIPF